MTFQSPKYIFSSFCESSHWSCNMSRNPVENDSVKWDIAKTGS